MWKKIHSKKHEIFVHQGKFFQGGKTQVSLQEDQELEWQEHRMVHNSGMMLLKF